MQRKHGDGRKDQIKRAPAQIQQRPADGVGQALRVAGHARHNIAHGRAVIVGEGQLLQAFESLFANEVAHPHLDASRNAQEEVNGRHLRRHQPYVHRDERRQAFRRSAGDKMVNGVSRHQREHRVNQRRYAHQRGGADQMPVERFGMAEQPPPQRRVKMLRIVLLFQILHVALPPPLTRSPRASRLPARSGYDKCAGTGPAAVSIPHACPAAPRAPAPAR